MSYSSVPMILLSFPGASAGSVAWSVVVATITLIGAGAVISTSYNTTTRDSLGHQLTDKLGTGNFNVCLSTYNKIIIPIISFNASWTDWNGEYIKRVRWNTVLNVNTDLQVYDVNTQKLLDLDSIL